MGFESELRKEIVRAMDRATAEAQLAAAVYEASGIIEELQCVGKVFGNGHYARQAIAAAAVQELRDRWKGD